MKRIFLLMFAAASLLAAPAAFAAAYPSKPIRIISPFAAGDAIDNTARILAERMHKELKTAVVVQNIAGGGGAVGLAEAARAAADGHTLVVASTGALTAGPLISQSGFEPEDFTPLARLVTMPLAVAVGENSPYKTLADLVAAGKSKELSYSTPGASSKQRIFMTQFAKDNGIKLAHIAGKSGNDAATKAMTGEVDFVCTPLAVFENLAKAGKLRVLAVASAEPVPYMPEVPTFKKAGYNVTGELWFGLLVRKGVPAEAMDVLKKAVADATAQKETKELYAKLRFEDGYLDSAAFGKVIQENIDNHKVILKELGLIK